MKKRSALVVGVMCVCALMVCALCACSSKAQTAEQQAQSENRAYMTTMNEIANELMTQLEGLSVAVLSGDTVTVTSKAKDALEVLNQLSEISVPDALADVHEHYKAACESLSAALTGYIDLYANAKDTSSAEYVAALAKIQEKYNDGIAELKAADEAAASKQ